MSSGHKTRNLVPLLSLLVVFAGVASEGQGSLFMLETAANNAFMRPEVSGLRRLYDFKPVSATNPVVACVKDCGIEIPVSELRSYVNSSPLRDGSIQHPVTLDQKRAKLEKLLNEHFLMWDGYQQKADQTKAITNMLACTKAMLLREMLVTQEAEAKGKTPGEYQRVYKELCDRIFDQTKITVFNESYDELKKAVRLLKLTPKPAAYDPDKLTPTVRDHVFAKCKIGFVTIGDILAAYARIPSEQRPNLEKPDGVNEILKKMLGDGLLTEEAQARGLEKDPIVLEKMQLNRNMMTRMYALNQIATEAAARAREPGGEARLKQWYENHLKDRYTYKDSQERAHVVSFEQRRTVIENDYVDDLREQMRSELVRAMRKDHKIEIDEKALAQADL